jgi:GcrA cell cycle regulator
MSDKDWPQERTDRLIELWNLKTPEGKDLHSTAEIGVMLGNITKSAVVGKAHRLGLPGRLSPIRPIGSAPLYANRTTRVRRAPRTTLPLGGAAAALPPTPARPIRLLTGGPCCWPIGEPGTRAFRFCEDPSLAGKPYCSAHCKTAYVKVRDLREARIDL